MTRKLTFILVSVALCLGACASPPHLFAPLRPSEPSPSVPFASGDLSLSNGTQSGEMGEIRGFSGAATQHTGTYDSYGSNLRLDSEGSGWWAMSSIHITGDLAGPAFAPGMRRTYVSGTYDPSNSVSVTGCSGPSYGDYTYDSGSDEVTIQIESLGGNNRRMHFETTYTAPGGGRQVTTGSVDYVLPGSGGATVDRGI